VCYGRCATETARSRVQAPCEWCGKTVARPPSELGARVFCSREHYWAWRKDPRVKPDRLRKPERPHCRVKGCSSSTYPSNARRYGSFDAATLTYICSKHGHVYRSSADEHASSSGSRASCGRRGCRNLAARPGRKFCSAACFGLALRKYARKSRFCKNPKCDRGGLDPTGRPRRAQLKMYRHGAKRQKYGKDFCSHGCQVAYRWARGDFAARRRRYGNCQLGGCTRPASPKGAGHFCSPEHSVAFASTALDGHLRMRSQDAENRVLEAWRDGVRGSRHLAAAAHASTKTVYRVLREHGKAVGSDARG